MTRARMYVTSIWVGVLLGMCANGAIAGECTGSDYVGTLERWADDPRGRDGPTLGEVEEAFQCLTAEPDDGGRWAGPIAAQYFLSWRQSPNSRRIIAMAVKYLDVLPTDTPDAMDLASHAAYLLALCGVSRVDDRDIVAMLTNGAVAKNGWLPYYALAGVGDPRVFGIMRDRYRYLTGSPSSALPARERVQLVNCLYHLPGDSVLAFVDSIAVYDPDSLVIARARHVLAARGR